MHNPGVRKQILHKVDPVWFSESPLHPIFIRLRKKYMEEQDFSFEDFLTDLDKETEKLYLEIIFDETNRVLEEDVQACLNISHSRKLERDKKEIEKLIKDADKKRNHKVASDLLRKHSELQKQILSLK